MTRKLQITNIFILFLLLALSNMAMTPSVQDSPTPTATAIHLKPAATDTRTVKIRATATPLQGASPSQPAGPTKTRIASNSLAMQAGHSDWIVVIGIFIVAIIVIPLVLKYKEWRGN